MGWAHNWHILEYDDIWRTMCNCVELCGLLMSRSVIWPNVGKRTAVGKHRFKFVTKSKSDFPPVWNEIECENLVRSYKDYRCAHTHTITYEHPYTHSNFMALRSATSMKLFLCEWKLCVGSNVYRPRVVYYNWMLAGNCLVIMWILEEVNNSFKRLF